MARRQIGQEGLRLSEGLARHRSSLDALAALLNWGEIDDVLHDISAAAKGERGWPPLALFQALLLATWHDLSDIRLAEALDDRASFRRFCGFAASEPTPERTAFVRFRAELVRRGLDRVLFTAVTSQLARRGVVVRTGTLVDATLIPSASTKHDDEARWAGHRRRKPVHGYKAHVGKYTWVRFTMPWNAVAGRHVIETRTTDNNGTTQPESVPLNNFGMVNWAVPKFQVEIA